MSSQLGVKRRFIDGRNDWRFQTEKAPVNTSGSQFIQGEKLFNDPITFYDDVICHGKYKGDGSLLTNLTVNDPSKLPLSGGTLTGSLIVAAPGIISGNGSGLTGVISTDNTKLPLAGGTMTGALTLTGAAVTVQVINSSAGGQLNPLTSVNLTSTGGGSLVEEAYNQRNASTGEFYRKSFFAKGTTGPKLEFANISAHAPNATTGSQKGRLDLDVTVNGTMNNFLSCNASSNHVDIKRTLHMNNHSIIQASSISTPSSNYYGKNTVQFYAGDSSFPSTSPEDQLRLTVINQGVPDAVLPLAASFPGTWGTITCSADFFGFTYVGTKSGFIYYSSDGVTWNAINDSFNGRVLCMTVFNGGLVVGGDFSITNLGTSASLIARVDSSNNVNAVNFSNYGSNGFNGESVRTLLASSSGYLYIGGKFNSDTSNALPVNNIAIMDSSVNLYCIDNSFVIGNTGTNGAVNFIAENSSYAPNYFVIGGEFNNFNNSASGYTANRNVVWKSNGAYDTDFGIPPYEVVYMNDVALCITLNGSQFYIGGYFSGLTYGSYLATFTWNGSAYNLDPNPYGASPSNPILAVYQNGGIYWSQNNGEFFDAGNSIAPAPYGSSWTWIYRTVWGQLLISTESGAQDPVIAFYFFTSDQVTLTLTGGQIYNGASVYTGGIILYNTGATVDLMFQAAYNRWYVVSQLGAGFF
jgi:hypothetical protein